MTPVTLITGASSGIGMELARVFAAHGHELVLVARRQRELTDLADEIAGKGAKRPIALAVDLAERDAVARIVAELKSRDREPANLINNAGFGLAGPSAVLDRAEQLAMIDVNVRALTELTLTFADSVARHRGGILNVASIVSFMPGPGMAVYYASKAYVLSFSEALHAELSPRGVRVTALCPGPVATGFQLRAGIRASTGGETSPLAIPARRVAEIGYDALMGGKRVAVAGFGNKIVVFFMRFLPHAVLLPMIKARMRFTSAANEQTL
jgi:short-subunit dehydrogenase